MRCGLGALLQSRRMMQLHYFPGNASMTPHMLLEELGVPHQRWSTARTTPSASPGALNPNGKIPVLVDGELVLYETKAAIVLGRHARTARVGSARGRARRKFYKWLMWLSNTLQAEMPLCFYSERWADGAEGAAQVKRHAEGNRRDDRPARGRALARHGGPWFGAKHFSALDPTC